MADLSLQIPHKDITFSTGAATYWATGENATVWEDCEDSNLQSGFGTSGAGISFGATDAEHNSAVDGGSGGMEFALDGTTRILYYQADDDDISLGYWFKTPNWGSNEGGLGIIYKWGDSVSMVADWNIYVDLYCDGCGMTPDLRFRGIDGTTGITTVSPDTWYWFSIHAVRNSTSTFTIYNTSGTLITSTTRTADNINCDYHLIGTGVNLAGTYFRVDDIVVYADGTWPLAP